MVKDLRDGTRVAARDRRTITTSVVEKEEDNSDKRDARVVKREAKKEEREAVQRSKEKR